MIGEYSLGQCRLEQCPWLPPLVCSVDRLQVNMEPCCRDIVFFTFSPILPGATSDNVEGWVVQWWGCSPPINVVRVWFPEVMPHICLLLVLALAPGSFSPGTPVLHKKATFPNSNLIRNIRQKKHSMDVPPLNHYLLILIELMLGKVRCVVLPPPCPLLLLCRVILLATNLPVTAVGLAQLVEHLTAEREVAGSIPGTGPILRVLK